jgi:LysM repeat protein
LSEAGRKTLFWSKGENNLSLMLLKRSVEVLVGAALVALMLAMVPAVAEAKAEAKEGAKAEAKAATHEEEEAQSAKDKRAAAAATQAAHTDTPHTVVVVVVRPGDSLWSISEEQLAPNATAQRIDRHTGRIYALNREWIGSDPNLILVGQELLVPSVGESSVGESSVGESSASSRSGPPARGEATRPPRQTTRTQEEQAAGGSARVSATGRATEANKAGQAPQQASEQARGQASGQASGQAPQRVTLPEVADAQPVPAARPPISEPISEPISDPISDPTSNDSSSPSLAVALVAWALLTLVAALVTWLLLTVVAFLVSGALRTRERKREARKRGELQAVLGTNYTRFDPLLWDSTLWGSILGPEETPWKPPSASGLADATTDEEEEGNGLEHLGLLATARARRERVRRGRTGRVARAARRPHGTVWRAWRASSVGAYGPEVFRAMLRARRPQTLKLTKLGGRAAERARRTRRRSR